MCRAGWATCSTWRPKDLEKIIYFASYVITSVDAEARHRDMSTIENEIFAEKRQAENSRDAEIEKRAAKLEADLAELEAEGAKADVRRKVKEAGEREMRQIRDRAQREIDRLDEVLDTFRKLDAKQLVTDELLYRELRDRFGEYFTGGMGAEAIKALLQNMDLDAEAELAARDHPQRQGPAQDPCAQAAQGRRGVPQHRATRRWAWCSTASRSSRRTCARWCSSTVAGSRPAT